MLYHVCHVTKRWIFTINKRVAAERAASSALCERAFSPDTAAVDLILYSMCYSLCRSWRLPLWLTWTAYWATSQYDRPRKTWLTAPDELAYRHRSEYRPTCMLTPASQRTSHTLASWMPVSDSLRFIVRYGCSILQLMCFAIWLSFTERFIQQKFKIDSSSIILHHVVSILCRGVHGNGKDWDPMGPMGFPWEWEYDQSWEWEWDGNGNKTHGNGN